LIPLGPFQLQSRIGKGGMAEVWRAVHRAQGVPVAVKVLTTRAAREPLFLSSFRAEVRGAAALDHPRIVLVLDHGLVDPVAEAASRGEFVDGSPYLVMELAGSSTLQSQLGRLSWPDVQGALFGLLDALAHAHARGVVHRDLKPANVLLDDHGDIKLVDFGLAHAFTQDEPGATGQAFMGTPAYMAPEQFETRWRDFGPWTDLYAVGCLAWALLTGEPPFGAQPEIDEAYAAHLQKEPPRFRPQTLVPDGLERWLRRLMEKAPPARFQRAADAAWALASLPPLPVLPTTRLRELPPRELRTLAFEPRTEATAAEDGTGGREGTSMGLARDRIDLPPLPGRWHGATPSSPPLLRGVGLGIYAFRALPLVDRDGERDALWALLRSVYGERRPQVVLLDGPAGSGKTRLARWVGERAHELGAAIVISAIHGEQEGPSDGVVAAIARQVRCLGMPRAELLPRLRSIFRIDGGDDDDAVALTELLAPLGEEGKERGERTVRLGSSRERYVLLRRLLERYAQERPVVLLLDDAQWGGDSLAFARSVLDAADLPVLIVATVRDDALRLRPAERSAVDALIDAGARRLPIGPLPPKHREELVRGLLGLDPALAAVLEERTAGNPQFAVQLVADWVDRGLLEAGPRGFRMRRGSQPRLPDALSEVWRDQLDRVLHDRPPADAMSLELAAVLGHEVDGTEWTRACNQGGVRPSRDLVDALLDARLLRPRERGAGTGFALAHAMLRETLVQRASTWGRLAAFHLVCAAALDSLPRDGDPRRDERLGDHLLHGGRARDALPPLLRAARTAVSGGDLRHAEVLLDRRDEALRLAAVPPSDPVRGESAVQRSRLARLRGELDEARKQGEIALAASGGGAALGCDARTELGNVALNQGDLAIARERLEEALDLAVSLRDRERIALIRRHQSYLLLSEGQVDAAAAMARRAVFAAEGVGDAGAVGHGYLMLSHCALVRGDRERGGFLLEEASLRFDAAGNRWGLATAANGLGELARQRGDREGAIKHYDDAIRAYQAIGSGDDAYPRLNRAIVLVDERRFADARGDLRDARRRFEEQGRVGMVAATSVADAVCAAEASDWVACGRDLDTAAAALRETGFVETEIARLAELACAAAARAGRIELAAAAAELAAAQWERLGKPERAASMRAVTGSQLA
jgi:serine/threonine protein kinase/tetratricopeptide (TPR) repeat protein